MSARIKILMSILSVFLFARVSAQEFYNSINPLTTKSNTLNYKLTGNQYYFQNSLNGTAYLNDKLSVGSIKLENGDQYKNVHLKLNTFLDELVIYNDRTGAIFYIDKSIVDEFDMGLEHNPYNLFRKVYFDKAPKGYHYLNVLCDGRVKLYLWHRTLETDTSPYYDDNGFLRASMYKQNDIYFIVLPDNSFHKVSPKRRSFLQLFPEQKSVLRKAFRENKIQFNNELEDAISAAKLIEQELF